MSDWMNASEFRRTMYSSEEGLPDNHVITIRERELSVDFPELIQNNIKTDTVTLDLDAEWDGLNPVIIFTPDTWNSEGVSVAYFGDPVHIPADAMDESCTLACSVCGVDASGEVRAVTKAAPDAFRVVASGDYVGKVTEDDAGLLGQLLDAVDKVDEAQENSSTAVENANTAVEQANNAIAAANKAISAIDQVIHQISMNKPYLYGRDIASAFASEIGSQNIYTWLQNRVKTADFSGLMIGDYIDVPITAGANVPAQTVRYRIGAFDQYYNCGDTSKTHHIVMVPLAPVTVSGDKATNTSYLQWRDTDDNNGTAEEKRPYLCSKLHDWEINDFLPALPTELQNAIMPQRVLLEERYSSLDKLTEASNWSDVNLGKIWSPSEMEVCGCLVWASNGYSVGFDSHFPIFTDTASRNVGGRIGWWLRSVVDESSSNVCCISGSGASTSVVPTTSTIRPFPCFLIG